MTKRKIPDAANAAPPGPFDKRKMIEALLARCRTAAETCFAYGDRNYGPLTTIQGFAVGGKLVKTALELAALLEEAPERRGEFTHRIIVERASAPVRALTPPPLPEKTAKTISGGSDAPAPQEGEEIA